MKKFKLKKAKQHIKAVSCVACGRNMIVLGDECEHIGDSTCICADCIESGYFWCNRKRKLCHFTHGDRCNNGVDCLNTRDNDATDYVIKSFH